MMTMITIPLDEYNILKNLKMIRDNNTNKYRQTDKGKKANALAQKRFRERQKAMAAK